MSLAPCCGPRSWVYLEKLSGPCNLCGHDFPEQENQAGGGAATEREGSTSTELVLVTNQAAQDTAMRAILDFLAKDPSTVQMLPTVKEVLAKVAELPETPPMAPNDAWKLSLARMQKASSD